MCLATSEDTIRGMLFNGTLEVLGSVGDGSLVKRCVEECGESRFLDFFSYPVRMHCQMVSTALPVLAEQYGDSEEALRQLGRLVAHRFLRVGAGKVMLFADAGQPAAAGVLVAGGLPHGGELRAVRGAVDGRPERPVHLEA